MNLAKYPKLQQVLEKRLSQLRVRSLEDIKNDGFQTETMRIDGKRITLSTYVERLDGEQLLVTLHASASRWFGLWGWHAEHGLVFDLDGNVRDATVDELVSTGM